MQVRHGPSFYDCSLRIEENNKTNDVTATVHISEDDQGLAAGQYAAFYQHKRCIGSGIILDSWDNKSFPVCKRALEIARMEDKSKLGAPVKIYTQVNATASKRRSVPRAVFSGSVLDWMRELGRRLRIL